MQMYVVVVAHVAGSSLNTVVAKTTILHGVPVLHYNHSGNTVSQDAECEFSYRQWFDFPVLFLTEGGGHFHVLFSDRVWFRLETGAVALTSDLERQTRGVRLGATYR